MCVRVCMCACGCDSLHSEKSYVCQHVHILMSLKVCPHMQSYNMGVASVPHCSMQADPAEAVVQAGAQLIAAITSHCSLPLLKCHEQASSRFCDQVYRRARGALGEILSAFEFLDRQALELTKDHLEIVDPLPHTNTQFYLVVETSGSNEEHDMAKLEVRGSSSFVHAVLLICL